MTTRAMRLLGLDEAAEAGAGPVDGMQIVLASSVYKSAPRLGACLTPRKATEPSGCLLVGFCVNPTRLSTTRTSNGAVASWNGVEGK